MKQRSFFLNTLLAGALTVCLAIAMLARIYIPGIILPAMNIPNLVLLSLAVVLAEHFLTPGSKRCYWLVAVLAGLSFLVLPWASGLVGGVALVKLTVGGAVVFTAVTWLFTSMCERMASGCHSAIAAVVSALGIFLASQAFTGIFL